MSLHLQHFSNSYFVNICKAKDKLVPIDKKKKKKQILCFAKAKVKKIIKFLNSDNTISFSFSMHG